MNLLEESAYRRNEEIKEVMKELRNLINDHGSEIAQRIKSLLFWTRTLILALLLYMLFFTAWRLF